MKKTSLLVLVSALGLRLVANASGQLPAGWQSEDVGAPNLPGSASYGGRGGVFTIMADGSDIGETWDQFHYVYQQRSGNFTITARILTVDGPDACAKTGVMIRETLDGDSKHSMVVLTAGNGVMFESRLETGVASFRTAGPAVTAPHWVRLMRQDNMLQGYASDNGFAWTPVGTELIAMGGEVFCGLVVTSQHADALCTGEFGSVSIDCMPRLVAYWNFDEGNGLIAHDVSCNNLHGTLVGDPQWAEGPPGLGVALDFDGDGDYVDCGSSPLFDLTNQITVAAWVRIRTVPGDWTSIVNKGLTAWRLETLYNTRRMHFAVTGEHYVDSDANIPADEWHHACGTYDGAGIRLYIDGEQDAASPAAYSGRLATNTNNLLIGRYSGGLSPGEWDGLIDDVRIYDYALSHDEILRLVCTEPPLGDSNGDCKVDFADLAILVSNWLTCSLPSRDLCWK